MTRAEQVGVFGGTFNPIHLGHLRAAEEVLEALSLDCVTFVPSATPPHKTAGPEGPLAPAEARLDWVRTATRDNPRFRVDDLEVRRGGASYTVDTLQTLGRAVAPELPTFLIGCDAVAEFGSWREPRRVLALAHLAVMTRPPVSAGSLADWLPKCVHDDLRLAPDGRSASHREAGSRIHLVEISALDISSSDVRRRLREGRSVRYLLPEPVREAVEESGVYA